MVGEGTWIEEEFGFSWYQEKSIGLWTNVVILYPDEDQKQNERFWSKIWGMVGGCIRIIYKGVGEKSNST